MGNSRQLAGQHIGTQGSEKPFIGSGPACDINDGAVQAWCKGLEEKSNLGIMKSITGELSVTWDTCTSWV
jgi:hypothetical protein